MNKVKPSDFFVLGYFGLDSGQLDGQTVKTRSVHRLFEEKLGGKVAYYDTEKLKKSRWSILPALFRIIRTKHLIYLPAQNNLKQFFPLLFMLSKLFRFQIHYFVVGGWLMKFITEHPSFGVKLKEISGIFIETNKLMADLNADGFKNVVWFPNFRFAFPVDISAPFSSNGLKLVFMSRITKLKGVDDILNANKFLFRLFPEIHSKIKIDFYGPLDPLYNNEFLDLISEFTNTIYKGILKPEEISSVLSSGYDIMLFPTRYPGEGCPGAIIDAFIAGLPVIATDWKYNNEFVKDGITGILISNEKVSDQIVKQIILIAQNPSILNNLKKNAHHEALRYSADNAWSVFQNKNKNTL